MGAHVETCGTQRLGFQWSGVYSSTLLENVDIVREQSTVQDFLRQQKAATAEVRVSAHPLILVYGVQGRNNQVDHLRGPTTTKCHFVSGLEHSTARSSVVMKTVPPTEHTGVTLTAPIQ